MNGLAEPTELTAGVGFDGDTAVGMIGDVELEDYLTTAEAFKIAKERGQTITQSAIAYAAYDGKIAGAKKMWDNPKAPWVFPKEAFLDWLENRNPRGRPPKENKDCS